MAPPKVKESDLVVGSKYNIKIRTLNGDAEYIKGDFYSTYKKDAITFTNVVYNGNKVDIYDIPKVLIIDITPVAKSYFSNYGGKSKRRNRRQKTRKY